VVDALDEANGWIARHHAADRDHVKRCPQRALQIRRRPDRNLHTAAVSHERYRVAALSRIALTVETLDDLVSNTSVVDRPVAGIGGDADLQSVADDDQHVEDIVGYLLTHALEPLPHAGQIPLSVQRIVGHRVWKDVMDDDRVGKALL
jgi:hypothetical protein